jgi:hypothetical protein
MAGLVTDRAEKHKHSAAMVVTNRDFTFFSLDYFGIPYEYCRISDTTSVARCSVTRQNTIKLNLQPVATVPVDNTLTRRDLCKTALVVSVGAERRRE